MLKAVRVEKHPDHGCDTLFRLFLDGELSCNFFVYDEVADELERLLNGEAERQRDELLAMVKRLEWIKPGKAKDPLYCPACFRIKEAGHHDEDCELAALLASSSGHSDESED